MKSINYHKDLRPSSHPIWLILMPALLLLFMFWALISTLSLTSPTYDEFEYITRGYTYRQTGITTLKLRHPILLDAVATLPLHLMSDIQLPVDHPTLASGDFHAFARLFFWDLNDDQADKMIFLARFMPIMLTLMMVALVFRWAKQRFGYGAGLLAMFLCALDPNVLAHGRLVAPDVGQTFFIFMAVYVWWRYLEKQSWQHLLLSGLALGLAQTAGFPALILYPVLAVITAVTLWPINKWNSVWLGTRALIGASLLSFIIIWAVYGFQWGNVSFLTFSVPAPYHWEEFWDLLQRLDRKDLAYLNGEVYRGGRLAFFPTAILSKLPLPTMIFILTGLWLLFRQHNWRKDISLWLLPTVYFITAVTSSLNLGYRYLMPIWPFMFILAGNSIPLLQKRRHRVVSILLLIWLALSTLNTYPYFLAYFNEMTADGTRRQRLVVSDLDWGQDLVGLRDFLADEKDDQPLFLSYFGTTPPEHYDIQYKPLPSWPLHKSITQSYYHPDYPLPGKYALSAANLMGARFENNPQLFAWFWEQEPIAEIGHSILIYEVPHLLDKNAPAVDVVLSGASLAQLPTTYIEQELHTNDLQPRWVNGQDGFILPAERAIVLLGGKDALDHDLADHILTDNVFEAEGGALLFDVDLHDFIADIPELQTKVFHESGFELLEPVAVNLPAKLETAVSFLGYEWLTTDTTPGSELKAISYWQINEPPPTPLRMFAHLLNSNNDIITQHDGLAAQTEYWHTGDVLIQIHRLILPEPVSDDLNWLAIGWYQPDGGARILLDDTSADHFLIPLPK